MFVCLQNWNYLFLVDSLRGDFGQTAAQNLLLVIEDMLSKKILDARISISFLVNVFLPFCDAELGVHVISAGHWFQGL